MEEDDCTIGDCVVNDRCVAEESYDSDVFCSDFVDVLQVGFSQSMVTVDEDAGNVTLIIYLNQNSLVTMPVNVMYSTSGAVEDACTNPATRDVDYTAVDNEVVFAVGEYVKNITIPILADSEKEEEEIFYVELATDCCADIVIRQVKVNIADDDCVITDCMVDDGCITEESYSADAFDSCFVETLQVGFTNSAVTINEDAGSVTLTIEINRSSWVSEPIIVRYSTSEAVGATNAATSNVDYATVNNKVVFGVGECTEKNITIPILADSEREEEEIFYVELATDCCADIVNQQVVVNIINVVPMLVQSSTNYASIIQSTSQPDIISMNTISQLQSVNTPITMIVSQTVNITVNEGAVDGGNNSSTIIAIVASITGGLLCIIGVCIMAVLIKKCKNRDHRKMRRLQFSSVSVEVNNRTSKDTFELKILTKSYMETLKKDFKDLHKLLIPANAVKMTEVIGEGEFGLVYKGIWTHQNVENEEIVSDLVALKSIKNYDSAENLKSFLHESNIMKTFDHPNVLSLLGVCMENNHEAGLPFIVLPFMANGDLKSYLKNHRTRLETVDQLPKGIKGNDLLDMCYQISCGMNYLATRRFVHRDLAARNCMVDESLNIKVADFGLTRDIYITDYYRQQSTGKIPAKWMAPEALNDKISNEKTDVWSYGITCWEVFSLGRTPYPTVSNYEILRHVEEGNRPDQPVLCPDSMYSLMLKCWELDASIRVNFKQIVEELSNLIN